MAKHSRQKQPLVMFGGWQWYWWLVLTAVGLTPLVFGTFFNSAFELPKLILLYGIALMAVAVFAWQCWVTKRFYWPRTWLEWPLLTFVLLLVGSTVFSVDWYTSMVGYYSRFNGGLLSLLTYIILFYLTLMGLRPPGEAGFDAKRLRQLLWVWLGSAGVVSVLAILQHVGFNYLCVVQGNWGSVGCAARLPRAISTFGQPNWLAAYLISAVPIGVTLGLSTLTRGSKAAAWILAGLAYAGLWYGYSRAAWVGLAVALVVLLICIPWKTWWGHRWWVAGLIAACVLLSATSFNTAALRAESLTDSTEADPSTSVTRLYVWQGTVPYILAHPLVGTGPGTFAYGFLPYRPRGLNDTVEWNGIFQQAHNEVLNRAATTGLPSLIAWLALFGVSGVLVWRAGCWGQLQGWWLRWRKESAVASISEGEELAVMAAAVLAGIIGIFVAQLFGFAVVVTNLLLFVGLGALVASQVRYTERSLELVSWRIGLVMGLGLIFCFGWYGLYRYGSAEALDRQGNDLAVAKVSDAQSLEYAYRTAADDYTLASQRNPLEAHYHADLAKLYGQMLRVITPDSRPQVIMAADEELKTAQRLNSQDLALQLQVADVYVDIAAYDQTYWQPTLRILQQAKRRAPTSAAVQMGLADVYMDMGDLPKAKAAFDRLVALRPTGAETYSHRANYWQKVGDVTAEKRDLEKALRLSLTKDKPTIQRRLDKLKGSS